MQHLEKDTLTSNCRQCGECCRGLLNGVKVTQQEWEDLEEHMGTYKLNPLITKKAKTSLRLPTKAEHDLKRGACQCIFLKDTNVCEAYERRPEECRRFPIWTIEGRVMITFVVSSICPRTESLVRHLRRYLPDWARKLLHGRSYRVVLI